MQRTICFFASVALTVAASSLAFADTILTYTGNPYTSATGPYTTSMFETASIHLASPLPINGGVAGAATFLIVQPISFTVSDGINTFTESTPGLNRETFAFVTDANGNILEWLVAVQQFINSQDIRGWFSCNSPYSRVNGWACDWGGAQPYTLPIVGAAGVWGYDEPYMFTGFGGTPGPLAGNANPGTWTIRNVPEPWSLPLLTIPAALAFLMLKKGRCRRRGYCQLGQSTDKLWS